MKIGPSTCSHYSDANPKKQLHIKCGEIRSAISNESPDIIINKNQCTFSSIILCRKVTSPLTNYMKRLPDTTPYLH